MAGLGRDPGRTGLGSTLGFVFGLLRDLLGMRVSGRRERGDQRRRLPVNFDRPLVVFPPSSRLGILHLALFLTPGMPCFPAPADALHLATRRPSCPNPGATRRFRSRTVPRPFPEARQLRLLVLVLWGVVALRHDWLAAL